MQIIINFETKNLQDLEPQDQKLVQEALRAKELAYAPYSNFKVGCALLLENGEIVTGNNQENAAYPSGLCAERVALFKSQTEGHKDILAMVVVAENAAGQIAEACPCGACRQVMMENATLQQAPIKIFMQASETTFHELANVKSLLPFSFSKDKL